MSKLTTIQTQLKITSTYRIYGPFKVRIGTASANILWGPLKGAYDSWEHAKYAIDHYLWQRAEIKAGNLRGPVKV